jgi:GDPmannose 4,6-dehydratase
MRALIFGITGQDGSYLADLLIAKGYEVHGVRRRASSFNTDRLTHLISNPDVWGKSFHLHYGDLSDSSSLNSIMTRVRPTEVYNLAAQSHVGVSFENPVSTADINAVGTTRILESIRALPDAHRPRFYQASTSEMFGGLDGAPLSERSPFHPQSPYSASKLMAYWMTRIYRESYGIFASNGILFNHESPRRGETFVTRKITIGLSRVAKGLQPKLVLGNLDAVRDWGHAKDFVEAMWLILQHDKPTDLVIATEKTMTVRQFVEAVAIRVGLKIEWRGVGVSEVGVDSSTGNEIVSVDSGYFRPLEVSHLLGDSSLARETLGWSTKITLEGMIDEMVKQDMHAAERDFQFPTLAQHA